MRSRKSKLTVIIFLAVAVPILVTHLVINLRYVFIGANKIPINSTAVSIDCRAQKIGKSFKRLKRISQIETLNLYGVSEDDNLEYISSANISDALLISYSDIDNSIFVNSLENIDVLFFHTSIDFQDISNETQIKSLQLILSNISNFEEIGKCQNVKRLEIYQCNFNDGNDLTGEQFNSTILSEFDNVNSLKISGMEITDINGFLNMESLNSLRVDKDCITEEQVAELQEAGITVEMK